MTIPVRYANFVGDGLRSNNIFDLSSPGNRDGCFEPYLLLRSLFLKHGVELNTPDLNHAKKVEFELHMDAQSRIRKGIPSYVVLYETPQIRSLNQRMDILKKYAAVFTWRDDWVNERQYIKLNLPNKIIRADCNGWLGRDRLCCLIAGNKAAANNSQQLLYAERVAAIRWFEQNAPEHFDLFGSGWDLPEARHGFAGKVIGRLQPYLPKRSGRVYFPSYRGKVANKLKTLSNYRFSICYENVRDLPGYITEKIFDSFFAGCVPVYWGASNIDTYIPEDCFIDRRKFANYEELYKFMTSITETEFIGYQKRIAAFLESDRAKAFSEEKFAETIVNTIVNDLCIEEHQQNTVID